MADEIGQTNCLFEQPWWLDAVAPGTWAAATVEENGRIVARLPYVVKKRYGLTLLSMPKLTQILGPWLELPDGPLNKRLEEENTLIDALVDQLPPFDIYRLACYYTFTNWQPFYWRQFQQRTCYTYVVQNICDLDAVLANFSRSRRSDLRKAAERYEVRQDLSADRFYAEFESSLTKKGQRPSYTLEFFRNIHTACCGRGAGKIFYSVDAGNTIHSGLMAVWDRRSAYAIIGFVNPDFPHTTAHTLCIWEAIKYLSGKTRCFDFEGSMIEGVAKNIQKYGAVQTPYFQLVKKSRRFRIVESGTSLVRDLFRSAPTEYYQHTGHN